MATKLGAPSRHRLQELRAHGSRGPERVALFLRGASPFSPEQIEALEKDGATVRTKAGHVVTADVPLEAVERIAEHEFVVACEVSGPLYPEGGDEPSSDAE
jgi:hypothetical protein